MLVDLFNSEIIGYAVGKKKDALLVEHAFMTCNVCLKEIEIFHTDRGNELKNKIIEDILSTFEITRSLREKGSPYDNAVAEAMFKAVKTEFVQDQKFESLEVLKLEFFDYANWYNNKRIHGSLNYETPVAYLEKLSI